MLKMSTVPALETHAKLDLLRVMLLSRLGDQRELLIHKRGKGWFQVHGMGHEALAALATLLRPDDYIFPYYRARALMLARGISSYDLALAYFAKRESSSGGRQMPGHYSSRRLNVFSVPTPTAANMLPACGTAWGMVLQGKDSVVLASVGDAASRQGEFFEAVAFALQEKLPVVFLVEDNKFGISTRTEKMLPFNLGVFNPEIVTHVNGRRVDEVLRAGGEAVRKARAGEGPSILWVDLDRLEAHTSSDDHYKYRSEAEIKEMAQRDPLVLLRDELIQAGELTQADYDALLHEIDEQLKAEYERAERAEDPRAEEVLDHNFGPEAESPAPPIPVGQRLHMANAVNLTLRKALEDDPNVVLFGEDIEDPKGGVFLYTKGLSNAFPKQVFNAPLAEATILGVAVGLAVYGMRPVFELQFIDFISPGWNQLVTNISTLRWRTFGDFKCPMTLYAPCGAYLPGGSLWHSMSNESYLVHTSGIKVAMPSTPADAAGLMWSAIHGDDPHIILIPKHLQKLETEVVQAEPVPFGSARVAREGVDVTVVAYGNTVELAQRAADAVADEASVEVLDLRSLVPVDLEAIRTSLEKTGRLVVVYEDNKTCGFGQAVVAEVTSNPETWNLFLSPPQIVAGLDVPIGYNPVYEYAALPSLEAVVQAIRVTLE